MTPRVLSIVFFDKIDNYFEISFPEKNISTMFKRKPFNPLMTEALIVSRKNKAKLLNKKLRKPSLITSNKFKEYNVVYKRLLRVVRKKYYDDKFDNTSRKSSRKPSYELSE